MLDLRGVKKIISRGSLSKMLEAWNKIVDVRKWKDHSARWDTGMIKDKGIPSSEETSNQVQDRKIDKIMLAINALPTFSRALKLSNRARGPSGLNVPFYSGNDFKYQQTVLVETVLKWRDDKFDFTASTSPIYQYHFLKSCWLYRVNPSIIEILLRDKNGLLDDIHLAMVVEYFVQYNKAASAGLIPGHSLPQFLLEESESTLFFNLLPILDLKLPTRRPLIFDKIWETEFESLREETPRQLYEAFPHMYPDKPTDDSFILTFMPMYVGFCEYTAAFRHGSDKYGMETLQSFYSESDLVNSIIPTLLNDNDQSKATAERLIIGLVSSLSQDNTHPAYVQKILTRTADHKMDDFSCEVVGQYTLQYKKKFYAAKRERLRTLKHSKVSSKSEPMAPQVAPYTSKAATDTILLAKKRANKEAVKQPIRRQRTKLLSLILDETK